MNEPLTDPRMDTVWMCDYCFVCSAVTNENGAWLCSECSKRVQRCAKCRKLFPKEDMVQQEDYAWLRLCTPCDEERKQLDQIPVCVCGRRMRLVREDKIPGGAVMSEFKCDPCIRDRSFACTPD